MTTLEAYAQHSQFTRAAHAIDDRPDFKMYIVQGVAYCQPLNARARDFLTGFDPQYQPWKPIRLTAYDIDVFTGLFKDGKIKLAMETLELDAI